MVDQPSEESHSVAEDSVRVVGLPGSLRGGSFTRRAVSIALQGASELGAQTELIDLRDLDLMFCDGEHHPEPSADVGRLQEKIASCQGLILGTPEYHGSYSGVLKNALDLLGFDEMEGKMIGLVGVSGGVMGGLSALHELRSVGRSLHAWVVPQQATVPRARQAFDDHGAKDPKVDEHLRQVGRQVARFAFLHHSEKAQEFLRLWEEAPVNPGGD